MSKRESPPPVFVRERVAFVETKNGPKSAVSLGDVEPIVGPEGLEYVFPVLGLSKASMVAIHPSYLPTDANSLEDQLAVSMRLDHAIQAEIEEAKRHLGIFYPGRPKKYSKIQRERKDALVKLRQTGKLTLLQIQDCRARARRLREECPWEEMFNKYGILPKDRKKVQRAVVMAEKRLYDAPRKLAQNRPSARARGRNNPE